MDAEEYIDQRFNCEFGGAVDVCAAKNPMHFLPPEDRYAGVPEKRPNYYAFLRLDDSSMGISPETPCDEQSPAPETPRYRSGREYLFGFEVLDELYSIFSKMIFDNDLACLFAVETRNNVTSVTVCNSWRLTKCVDSPKIDFEVRNWRSGGWTAGAWLDVPDIMLVPETPSPTLARDLLEKAICDFVNSIYGHTINERNVLVEWRKTTVPLRDLTLALAKTRIICFEGNAGAQELDSLSLTLSKVMWKFLIDPEFAKVVDCAMTGSDVRLRDYWQVSQFHATFTRLYHQDREVLPLFEHISMEELEKPMPFSIWRWTAEGVEFEGADEKIRLSGPASYRALMATDPAIVRTWADSSVFHGVFAMLFDLQADIADEGPIPSPVLLFIANEISLYYYRMSKEWDRYVWLIRHFVRECNRRITLPEFHTYDEVVDSIGLRNILDWWSKQEDCSDEPNRHITWSGIESEASRWHHK